MTKEQLNRLQTAERYDLGYTKMMRRASMATTARESKKIIHKYAEKVYKKGV